MKVTLVVEDSGALGLQVERNGDLSNEQATNQVMDMLSDAYYSLALNPLEDSEVVY